MDLPEYEDRKINKRTIKVIGGALKKYDKTPAGKIAKQERFYFGDSQPTPKISAGKSREAKINADIATRFKPREEGMERETPKGSKAMAGRARRERLERDIEKRYMGRKNSGEMALGG